MKRTILLSTSILFLFLINAFPQDKEEPSFYRHQIGIQFNPLINERVLGTGGLRIIDAVSSLRYGYRITKNVTSGMEFSCNFPININSSDRNFQYYKYFSYRIGLLTRYSILSDKRFQVFTEVSPYFAHVHKEVWNSGDPTPYRNDKFGCYAAPGVTLYSKSRRVSFDLYSEFDFTGHTRLSYKVNYNF